MTIRPHTTDADVVVARLEVNDRVVLGVTNTARSLLRHKSILDLVEDSAIMPGMVKLRRDRGSLDSTRRPLLSAPRHGDPLPLPPVLGRAPEHDAARYSHDEREEAPHRQHDDDHRGHPVLFFFHGLGPVQGVVPTQFPVCLLYTSPSPRDATLSRMPSSA